MAFEDGVERTDLYALLGVVSGASEKEIWSGYREQIQRWHPDRNPHPEATARTQAINNAHDVLKVAGSRLRHRTTSAARAKPAAPPSAAQQAHKADRQRRWDAEYAAWEEADKVRQEKQDRFRAYLEIEEAMQALYARRDLEGALAACLKAMPFLPRIVEEVIETAVDAGQLGWRPGPWQPVTMGLYLAPILADETAIHAIARVIAASANMADWMPLVEDAWAALEIRHRVLAYIESHAGCIQEGLPAILHLDPVAVQHYCYWLGEAGLIGRVKRGRSYELYPA